MKYKLLIYIIIQIFSSSLFANHLGDFENISGGGWLNRTFTSQEYMLDDYFDAGVYGSYVHSNTSVSGMAFYDPKAEVGRLGYLYASQSLPLGNHSIILSGGLIRSDWGFWTKSLINPSTAPGLLKSDAIYHVGFENDLFQGLGISALIERKNLKLTLFAGSNYTSDEDEFIANTYGQKVDLNTKFGSNAYGLFEYSTAPGEFIRFGFLTGNLSEEINLDVERYILGYKYERNNWIFTAEYQEMHFNGEVTFDNDIPGMEGKLIFRDAFVYLGYNFEQCRLYSIVSVSDRPEDFSEYIIKATLKNSITDRTFAVPDYDKLDLLAEDTHRSSTLSIGLDYELTENLNIRAEGSYIHAVGGKRMFNTRDGEIRDRDTFYFGLGITRSF